MHGYTIDRRANILINNEYRFRNINKNTHTLESHTTHYYTVSQKKQDTKLLPITSTNVNRFSKFFHWYTHW